MRRMITGGLGIAGLAWVLGSSDWRGYWSQFWSTARTQLGPSAAIDGHDRVAPEGSRGTQRESVSLPR